MITEEKIEKKRPEMKERWTLVPPNEVRRGVREEERAGCCFCCCCIMINMVIIISNGWSRCVRSVCVYPHGWYIIIEERTRGDFFLPFLSFWMVHPRPCKRSKKKQEEEARWEIFGGELGGRNYVFTIDTLSLSSFSAHFRPSLGRRMVFFCCPGMRSGGCCCCLAWWRWSKWWWWRSFCPTLFHFGPLFVASSLHSFHLPKYYYLFFFIFWCWLLVLLMMIRRRKERRGGEGERNPSSISLHHQFFAPTHGDDDPTAIHPFFYSPLDLSSPLPLFFFFTILLYQQHQESRPLLLTCDVVLLQDDPSLYFSRNLSRRPEQPTSSPSSNDEVTMPPE